MGNQEAKQASVRATTGTQLDYNSDWHALFDLSGIGPFGWNGRLLAWLNLKMGTTYADLSSAMAAFAIANGAKDWDSLGSFSAAIYDPAATALFARMTVQPNNTRKSLINSTILSFKSTGIWPKCDAIWVQAAHDAQAARLNWKGDIYNLTAVNAPTFVVDRGYSGDGSTSLLGTGLTPAAPGLKFVQNSSHVSFYNRTTRAGDASLQMGVFTGATATYLQTRDASNQLNTALNDAGSGPAVVNAANPGFYALDRLAAGQFLVFKNGSQVGTSVIASSAPDNTAQLGILAVISSGGTVGFAADQVGFNTIGEGLGPTMEGQLYTIAQTYMTAIGAAV